MGWGAFLVAIAGTVAKRVLIALGFGFISYAGFGIAQGAIESAIDSALSQIWSDVYAVLALAGMIDSIGIWLGSFVAIAALGAMTRLGALQS